MAAFIGKPYMVVLKGGIHLIRDLKNLKKMNTRVKQRILARTITLEPTIVD